jgi:hypothetical protein
MRLTQTLVARGKKKALGQVPRAFLRDSFIVSASRPTKNLDVGRQAVYYVKKGFYQLETVQRYGIFFILPFFLKGFGLGV